MPDLTRPSQSLQSVTGPYYADDAVTLYHGDCLDLLPMLGVEADVTITDPPYDANTHAKALVNKGRRVAGPDIDFEAFTTDDLRASLALCASVTRRWVIATVDYRHAVTFHDAPPDGLRLLRIGVWTKPNPMPQVSGDRPGQGWESIAFLHKTDVRPTWNGGGRSSVWHLPADGNQGHPTAKPLVMVREWVRLFTDPGALVLDPFAGSGTTLRAAKDEGRRAVGVELQARYCDVAAARLAQDVLDFGGAA
jgi:site-specific DNA-methyltransferase (adenine-specific)